jgi:hypothetical protein
MDNNFNLIQALQDDWDAVSESPRYRAALGRWQQSEPALGGERGVAPIGIRHRLAASPS